MKNLVIAFALLCSTSLVAQFSYHVDENGVSGTGIQSPTNTASGVYSIAMGSSAQANGGYSTVIGTQSVATDIGSIAIGGGVNSDGLYSVGLGSSIAASGDYSMAMGYETQASGYSSTAMGNGTTANGDYSTAMGIGTQASGDYSTTMGNETIASGNTSTAMGNNTTASGSTSTALGYQTNASGNQSIAIGWRTNSNGAVSTAIGAATNAEDYISFAIGAYNKTDETPNPDSFSFENTAFVIGNGGFNSNGDFIGTDESRSNAFEVLFDGTTTIAGDVTAPAFIGDGSQLTNLPTPTVNYSDITNVPLSYNENGTGIQSSSNNASGGYSIAMGRNTTASGTQSTAMGYLTTASGTQSTAIGLYTTASGTQSRAMGYNTTASGYISTAMGTNTTASGGVSTAMGLGTATQDYASTAIGAYNKTKETPNPSEFSLQNTAFVIGNGTDESRSNAFEVLFDGTTTIAGELNINSDARLKANIISLGSTLSKLLQIDGKSYTMKKDESEKQKIGLLAQDIEKVFPELVSESHGVKSVNYQGLVPVLINALKEQDAMMKEQDETMKEQDSRLSKQQSEIDELKTMLKAIIEKT